MSAFIIRDRSGEVIGRCENMQSAALLVRRGGPGTIATNRQGTIVEEHPATSTADTRRHARRDYRERQATPPEAQRKNDPPQETQIEVPVTPRVVEIESEDPLAEALEAVEEVLDDPRAFEDLSTGSTATLERKEEEEEEEEEEAPAVPQPNPDAHPLPSAHAAPTREAEPQPSPCKNADCKSMVWPRLNNKGLALHPDDVGYCQRCRRVRRLERRTTTKRWAEESAALPVQASAGDFHDEVKLLAAPLVALLSRRLSELVEQEIDRRLAAHPEVIRARRVLAAVEGAK